MDTLQLEIYEGIITDSPALLVRILINGEDLLEKVTEIEGVEKRKAYEADMANGIWPGKFFPKVYNYAGLFPNDVFLPSRRFLGDPEASGHQSHHDNGKIAVLGCTCGEEGCSSFTARITISRDIVIWDAFEKHWNPTFDFSMLGPYVFDRKQYTDELRKYQPERMALDMSELMPSTVRKGATFNIEHFYLDDAKTNDYFEVWHDVEKDVSTIYYLPQRWNHCRYLVGAQFHKPEHVKEEIIRYAERWGYQIDGEKDEES